MPRDGRNRRRRPIDRILEPSKPSLPQEPDYPTSIPKGEGKISPIDTVLGGGSTRWQPEQPGPGQQLQFGSGKGASKNPWENPFMEVTRKRKLVQWRT